MVVVHADRVARRDVVSAVGEADFVADAGGALNDAVGEAESCGRGKGEEGLVWDIRE